MEKAKNEAATAEMKRQIAFLRSTQLQANCATQGPGTHSCNTAHILNIPSHPPLCASSSHAKPSMGGNNSNTNNQNIGTNSSQGF